jgi:predicted nucleotidyltransferase
MVIVAQEDSSAQTRQLPPYTQEIIHTLRMHLPELQERYGISYLGVFGSYIRGQQRKRSDLDVLVEFDDRPLTLFQLLALERYLSELVGIPVDLVEKETLKPTIGRYILAEVVPV